MAPLSPASAAASASAADAGSGAPTGGQPPRDRLGRPLGVLRLSLTARCNLACPYCCPDAQDPPDLLTLKERVQVVEAAVALGAHTLRLTGGEPLLHPRLEALVEAVQPLRRRREGDPRGRLAQVALTSNGVLLDASRARALKAAGLDRLTLSLDGSDGASVARMAGLTGGPGAGEAVLARVLAAIGHARAAGFDPATGALKMNAVIRRDANADQLLPLAALARDLGVELRLIEFMDVGSRNGWHPERVLTAAEITERIGRRWPLQPVGRAAHGTAAQWRYSDGAGAAAGRPAGDRLAVVASISEPFCGDCDRLRVTADGVAYTCLFAASGTDLRPSLRGGGDGSSAEPTPADSEALRRVMAELWQGRADRWSEERGERLAGQEAGPPHAEMAYLGG